MPETLPLQTNGDARDSELLRTLSWSEEPKRLAAASKAGDVPMFAREARRELRRRFGGKRIRAAELATRFPLHESEALDSYRRVAGEAGGERTDSLMRVPTLIRLVALFDGLRRGGSRLSEDSLWPLWSEAWRQASQISETHADDSPLIQMLAAEALLASGILFDGAAGMRARRKQARARLLTEIEARTDTDGAPHAELLPILPAWFASLARCASWGKLGRLRLWNAEYSGRFDGLLRAVAALAGPDGSIALSKKADVRPVLGEALACSGWKHGSAVGDLVNRLERCSAESLRGSSIRESVPRKIDKASPAIVQSDWAKLAVSRSRWRPNADLLAVAHATAVPSIEFVALGRRVFSGDWRFRVRLDGAALQLPDDCGAVSWFSDKDADYIELQWTTEPGLVVCRQALLTRGDHQLVIADCVSSPGRPEAEVEIETTLPFASGVSGQALRPGREVRLNADGLSIHCLPIALPMDRIDRGTGSLESETDALVVKQTGRGAAYMPLVFDWNPRRSDAAIDWRRLTVTEDGRKLDFNAAAASRVRIGKRQLLVYRNLNGSKAKRAVLGHHHDHESVIARFTAEGEVEPLVFVE
jgi:hypothetical protein